MSDLETLLRASLEPKVEGSEWVRPLRLIGGTDIGKLVGCSKYGGPESVYRRLRLGIEEPSNAKMERGTREEPVIRGKFVAAYGIVLEPHPGVVTHPTCEFATISPDDFCVYGDDPATVDYKSVSIWAAKQWGLPGTDNVPEHIDCQLRWAMACTNRNLGVVYASFGEDKDDGSFAHKWQATYFIRRDLEMEAMLLEAGRRFWTRHLLPGIPPPPDKTEKKTRKKKAAKGVANEQ